jgi:hypothetical protein
MKRILVAFGVLCSLIACSNAGNLGNSDAQQNAEAEIRAAICEIENGDFKAAQSTLETVLKKDPKNIYALRLLPGVAARQIKRGDKSPENVALIRKAIEAYERARMNPVLKNENEDINDFIVELYGMIGGGEKSAALLAKAENESETPKQRAVFYTKLAADRYVCANDVSDVAPVKSTVKRQGREVYAFRRPQNPADFERLKQCAAQGSELIGKAIALDPASDTAWIYRSNLSVQLARIAEMDGKTEEKARLIKESDAARAKFLELSHQRADQERAADRKLSKSFDDEQKLSSAGFSEAQLKEFSEEFKSYRAERPLAETVDRVDVPSELIELVAPLEDPATLPLDAAAEAPRPDDEKQKREWAAFAPEGGLSADLPDNAAVSTAGDSRIYTASGNGLSFFIVETSRSRDLSETEQDTALNVLARTITKYLGDRYIGGGGRNDRFESELTRKDKLADRAARFYDYRLVSCREKKEGAMIFVIGRKKNYAIDIRGAGESDENVRRFLKSLKLD